MSVLYEKRGHIGYVTLNRPEAMNAYNGAMRTRLAQVWAEIRTDDDVWLAILTGAGERAFSAGADVKELAASQKAAAPVSNGVAHWKMYPAETLEGGFELWKPIIAAINGYCLGIGVTIAIACDFRIASERARFGFPEPKLGLPTVMGSIRLPGIVGMPDALRLLMLGDQIDAQEALRIGLVGSVVPQERLLPEAETLAERLLRNGPHAVWATKEIAIRSKQMPFLDAVRLGESLRKLARETEDAVEGPRAFLEKRPPAFKGR